MNLLFIEELCSFDWHWYASDLIFFGQSCSSTLMCPWNVYEFVIDGRIRQVYKIIYQVIKWKVSIVSRRIFISSKQFTLLILSWQKNKEIRVKRFAIFIYLQQSKLLVFGCRKVTTVRGFFESPLFICWIFN